MKKFLALFLAFCLTVSVFPAALAAEVSSEDEIEAAAIEELIEEALAPAEVEEVTMPEVIEDSAPAEEAVAEEVTEAAAEEVEQTEDVPTEATPEEVTEEATAPEETEAPAAEEAAEEIPEEAQPEEEDALDEDPSEKAAWTDAPTNVKIYQTSNKKVYISWSASYKAKSYIVYESVNGRQVKRGYTTTKYITLKNVGYGYHFYAIYPCGSAKGSVSGGTGNPAFTTITTYNQKWRSAPSISLKQDASTEGSFWFTCSRNATASGYSIEIITPSYRAEYLYNEFGGFAGTRSAGEAGYCESIDSLERVSGNSDAHDLTLDKATDLWRDWGSMPDLKNGGTVKVRVACLGRVNDQGTLDYGKYSSYKTLRMTPQWKKAPKITSVDTSHTACKTTIYFNYYGTPDMFALYSNGRLVGSFDPSGTNQDSVTINADGPGKFTFKIVPWKDGFAGKGASKSVTMKIDWMKVKPAVYLTQPATNSVNIAWKAISGVTGYEVCEVTDGTYNTVGRTTGTSLTVKNVSIGKHTYVVRPYYSTTSNVGTFSSKKSITVKYADAVTTYRALVVGNTYENNDKINSLPGCGTDATTMTSMLRSFKKTPYTVTKVNNHTASQILSDIRTAFAGADDNDISLFYYSGHGYNGTGYLVGSDGSSLSFYDLRKALDLIPGKKIVILDSCFSGNAVNKTLDDTLPSDEDLNAFTDAAVGAFYEPNQKSGELAAKNYYVISAASRIQTSSETSFDGSRCGAFTYFFEKVCGWDEPSNLQLRFAAADSNGDTKITFKEAFSAASAAVLNSPHRFTQVAKSNAPSSTLMLFGR